MHDDWIAVFRARAVPTLKSLFTAGHDFNTLPAIISEPLRRLALLEQQRG